jgi:hypothetical protein
MDTELIYILFDVYRYVTKEADPDNRWSGEDTDANVSFKSVHRHMPKNTSSYEEMYPCFPMEYDKTYFVVWAEFSTGDSFSNSGGHYEVIDVFLDESLAEKCAHNAEHEMKEENWLKFYTYERQNGEVIRQSCPWAGYFNSLDDVRVESFRLEY